jgi:hypothetical protein
MSHHLSEDEICRAVAGQPTLEELKHLDACPACRDEVERSRSLLATFRRGVTGWADREARRGTPSLDLASIDAPTWKQALIAVALVVIVASLVPQLRRANQPHPADMADSGSSATRSQNAAPSQMPLPTTEFIPLVYSEVPLTDGHIVRLEVPRAALAAFGLEPRDVAQGRSGAFLADVAVGEDGLARAVRFVRPFADDTVQKERLP